MRAGSIIAQLPEHGAILRADGLAGLFAPGRGQQLAGAVRWPGLSAGRGREG
jgi:hypothetical protein